MNNSDEKIQSKPALVSHFLAETLQFVAVAKELNCKNPLWFCLPMGLSVIAL